MRVVIFSLFFLIVLFSSASGQIRESVLRGFLVSNKNHEKYTLSFNGEWIMTAKGKAYALYFEIDRIDISQTPGYIKGFELYRKTIFGRKKISFVVPYDATKKFLIINRDRKQPRNHPINIYWTDIEPALPAIK